MKSNIYRNHCFRKQYIHITETGSFVLCIVSLLLWALATDVLAQKPDLFLLKTYQHSQKITGWVMSEKLDGVRAYWDGHQLISRGGLVFKAPDWFTRGFPPFELDGELWTKRNDFENIVSIVRRKRSSDGWSKITYHIFEVPHQPGGLLQRLAVLRAYLQSLSLPVAFLNSEASKIDDLAEGLNQTGIRLLAEKPAYIYIVPQIKIKNKAFFNDFFQQVVKAGGEGVVIRNPATLYQTGRLADALKVKPFQDAECDVIGYLPGQGKYQGQTGALKCRLSDKTVIHIGTGLSDRQRQNPPAIGSSITFKYYGLTKKGVPRFPVFLRLRSFQTGS